MAWTALSFSIGQILTAAQVNGLQENARQARIAHYGTSAPAAPENGTEWWDSSTGIIVKKVYTGGLWVPTLFLDTTVSSPDAGIAVDGAAEWGSFPVVTRSRTRTDFQGPPHTPKNMLLNGAMNFWQRGNSFAVASGKNFAADRWYLDAVGSVQVSVRQSSENPVAGPSIYSFEVLVTSADASVGANDHLAIVQPVEQSYLSRTLLGTPNARTSRFSFWFWANVTGRYSVYLSSASRTATYVSYFDYSAGSVWAFQQFIVPPTSFQAFANPNINLGAYVGVCLAGGSTLQTSTPNAWVWNGPDVRVVSGQLAGVSPRGNTFRLTEVQWELGELATPFDVLPTAIELPQLQRYFWKTFPSEIAPKMNVGSYDGCIVALADTTGRIYTTVRFATGMRAVPLISTYNPKANNNNWYNYDDTASGPDANVFAKGEESAIIYCTVSAANASDFLMLHMTADAEFSV